MLGPRKGWLTPAAAVGITAALLAAAPAFADTPVQIAQAVSSGPFVPGLLGDDQVREGFVSGLLLILFSELGDKTFFIAVLLAVKYRQSQGLVFAGAFGALAAMTMISVGLGLVLHEADQIFDTGGIPLDDIVAIALLLFFGIRTLQEAGNADDKAKEEEEEAQETVTAFNDAAGLVVSTFALVFAAEWGDKSFLATIALAASSSPLGVVGGAITGHGVATVIAIVGGKVLSKYVSERTLQYIGGSLFLLFAATQLLDLVRGV